MQRDSSQVATKGGQDWKKRSAYLECQRKHWERAIALVMSVAMEMKETCPARWRCTLFRRIRSSKSILNYVMSSTISGDVVGGRL